MFNILTPTKTRHTGYKFQVKENNESKKRFCKTQTSQKTTKTS